jgi:hypothetical protein
MVVLQFRQLSIPPGQRLVVRDVSWQAMEAILGELGEHRAARIAYHKNTLRDVQLLLNPYAIGILCSENTGNENVMA